MTTPAKQPKIVRLIKYYWSTRRLVGFVTDWYVLPLAYLGLINLSNGRVLHLKNQLQFKVKHFLDAVGILEVFVDNEYHFPKVTKKFTVVDIGANIGAFTIFAALKSPQVKVISYEPSKSTYQLLNYNVETNGLSEQVMTNQLAAWGKQTTLKLYNPGPSGLRSLYQTRKETKYEAVKTVTLKNIFLKNKLAEIDYLKLDCEGAEYEILQSCPKDLIKKIKQMAIEFHELTPQQQHSQIIDLLKKSGFKVSGHYHHIENNIGYIYARR